MLRLVKWVSYRDRVLEHLDTLLVFYPRGRQFDVDFPDMRAAIRTHFDEGASHASSAVLLAAAIVGDIVGQLDPVERRTVLDALPTLDRDSFAASVSRQISRRPEKVNDRVGFAARLVGGALLMAQRMAEEGSLGAAEHEALLAELDRALPKTGKEPSLRNLFSASRGGQGANKIADAIE